MNPTIQTKPLTKSMAIATFGATKSPGFAEIFPVVLQKGGNETITIIKRLCIESYACKIEGRQGHIKKKRSARAWRTNRNLSG